MGMKFPFDISFHPIEHFHKPFANSLIIVCLCSLYVYVVVVIIADGVRLPSESRFVCIQSYKVMSQFER